jgi:cobalamin synthase
VYLLMSLHIVALEDRLSYMILIFLGGCCHLDGLEATKELWQEW